MEKKENAATGYKMNTQKVKTQPHLGLGLGITSKGSLQIRSVGESLY